MTETAGSIVTDEHNAATDGAEFDGVNAFLSNLEDVPKKEPSDEGKEAPEAAENETVAETEENTESDDPDDAEIDVKVGEETKKAKLRDLKRLFGQEAALTQKSQALAEVRTKTDAAYQRAETALKGMLERAEAAAKPYAELDFLVLAQQMDPESFKQLRVDAKAAQASVDYLKGELDGTMRANTERAQVEFQQAAQKCRVALEDPKSGIEGFGPQLYNELAGWAKDQGLSQFHTLVDPSAIKVVHMAMLYARGQTAAKKAEAKVTKAVAQPTRVMKPGTAKQENASANKRAETIAALRKSDTDDNRLAAWMANLGG